MKNSSIFLGGDYYTKAQIEPFIRELVGLGQHKPFECVGTQEESALAIALSIERYKKENKTVPALLLSLQKELDINEQKTVKILEERITKQWGQDYFLPPEYAALLKKTITKAQNT